MRKFNTVRPVMWEEGHLKLLDQRILPHHHQYISLHTATDTAQAIQDMVVRGAPAIGITAAYGVVLSVQQHLEYSGASWKAQVLSDMDVLAQSRPTAVNLFWALAEMKNCLDSPEASDISIYLQKANQILEEDIAANHVMGALGESCLGDNVNVLTHCNAGALATGGYGTALGVIRSGIAANKIVQVYAGETRPWLQGARLTAWELLQDDIPVTLIAEGAAGQLMAAGRVQWVIVGSDRIAANGDVANKIGTYNLAVLAKYHDVRFMVVAPSTTIDMSTETGRTIPIEQRDKDELLQFAGSQIAALGTNAINPAFDITPAELVDVIITEKGIVENPTAEKMRILMST